MSLKLPLAPGDYDKGDQAQMRGAIERADQQNRKRREDLVLGPEQRLVFYDEQGAERHFTGAVLSGLVRSDLAGQGLTPAEQANARANIAAGSVTLATVNPTPGAFGDAMHVGRFTVDAKGLIAAAANIAINFPITTFNGRTGAIALTSSDVTTALGYTPADEAAALWGFAFEKDLSVAVTGVALVDFSSAVAWTLPAGLPLASVRLSDDGTAPTAQTDFDLQVNGTSVGTVRFAASAASATLIMASAAAVPAYGKVQIFPPASLNGMGGRVYGSIVGER